MAMWRVRGKMIDATFVEVPRQRNSQEENAGIKAGEPPEVWDKKPAKRRQKDVDARWTRRMKRGTTATKTIYCRRSQQAGAELCSERCGGA